MFVGCVVYHQVHDYPQASLVGFCEHLVEVLHSPEFIHDCLIITDIVAVIIVR